MPDKNRLAVQMVAVDKLQPNAFNPNMMSAEQFGQYVAEVRHVGRIPKPIVVRQIGDKFEIIDGEHAWRAAKALEFAEVPCEIVDIDDAEARRQCYKRNQHGQHNRILEGRLFADMMRLQSISQRQLARELKVADGTIRNSLAYAKAAELRKRYALEQGRDPAEVDTEISRLHLRRVKAYLRLPALFRDEWLDQGALLPESCDVLGAAQAVEEFEFDDLIDQRWPLRSLRRLWPYMEILLAISDVRDVAPYLRPLIERKLAPELIHNLPIDQETGTILIDLDRWQQILDEVDSEQPLIHLRQVVAHQVEMELAAMGRDVDSAIKLNEAQLSEAVAKGPACLRDSAYLTLTEKHAVLCEYTAWNGCEEQALELMLQYVEQARQGNAANGRQLNPQKILKRIDRRMQQFQEIAEENRLFSSREALIPAVCDGTTFILPGLAADQLEHLSDSELTLLTAVVRGTDNVKLPIVRWFEVFRSGRLPVADPHEPEDYVNINLFGVGFGVNEANDDSGKNSHARKQLPE